MRESRTSSASAARRGFPWESREDPGGEGLKEHSGPTSHVEQGQAPRAFLRNKGGFHHPPEARAVLMPSLLLRLCFPGHFTHKVPSGCSLDEAAWSCPRGHPLVGLACNTPGRHPASGELWLGRVASGGTAWRRAGARHTHSSRSPACSSAGPGGTSAGPSCMRPWW